MSRRRSHHGVWCRAQSICDRSSCQGAVPEQQIPWTYEGSVGSPKQQMGVMGITHSSWIYDNLEVANKGKALVVAHISLFALLLSSKPLKVLMVVHDPKETTPDRIEETMGSIFSNHIFFSDDELTSVGFGYS
ncbi:hypothetical protein CRG98_018447 [Punica granatum]|uniref:Uncharacterized protein n=1 Tax=Punica granatum TaxID=22663 RepID=A0A2I0JXR7_PUNGR|nr:hypothetical protein CRG98_018447 [Punica granatum]